MNIEKKTFAKKLTQHPIVETQKQCSPAITQLAKLKTGEPIEDKAEQLERSLEHYSKL